MQRCLCLRLTGLPIGKFSLSFQYTKNSRKKGRKAEKIIAARTANFAIMEKRVCNGVTETCPAGKAVKKELAIMKDWKTLFAVPAFRWIDQSEPDTVEAMASFAIDDALAISAGSLHSPPAARLWVHDHTLMLGIPDARLPHLKGAIQWLKQKGFHPVVRNSGGLAVLLDQGVLNLSFILPDAKNTGIHAGYEAMVRFIQLAFQDLTNRIEVFEVTGSYCPGDYDLSIGGKKFAGISQRRVKNGSAVQIYLCVEGDGEKRAAFVRNFYEIGVRGEASRFTYPEIRPETMASLSQLLERKLSIADVSRRIRNTLLLLGPSLEKDSFSSQEQQWFEQRLEQMKERNEKALGNLQ